jgi:hypothetical protein
MCDTLTKCPVDHQLKANAETLECAGASCDETMDAAQCCEADVDTSSCAVRQKCVEEFFEHMTSFEFVEFECQCNEQYQYYTENYVWPDGTTNECKQFIACLNNEVGASVKVLTGLAKALKEYKEGANNSSHNSNCFSPTPGKYEELTECGCLKELVQACGDDAGTLPADECLKNHACKHEQVCDDWQAANCPAMALQLHAGGGISDVVKGDVALQTNARRLDETLQSKCA